MCLSNSSARLSPHSPQFERKRLNLPLDAPVVVQQWTGLIAISYPARASGITRHENIYEVRLYSQQWRHLIEHATQAKKKCPNLVPVHVATYKEGAEEPGYWDEAPTQGSHKVGAFVSTKTHTKSAAGISRSLSKRGRQGAQIHAGRIPELRD